MDSSDGWLICDCGENRFHIEYSPFQGYLTARFVCINCNNWRVERLGKLEEE